MAVKYHDINSCNKCKGKNDLIKPYYEDGHILMESETKCTICGFRDYWAHGFFESGSEIKSNCETYSFD